MAENVAQTPEQKLYAERLNRVETAIRLGQPDRVPVTPFIASYAQRANGSCYADLYYNYEKAGEAAVQFYKDHPMIDACTFSGFTSTRPPATAVRAVTAFSDTSTILARPSLLKWVKSLMLASRRAPRPVILCRDTPIVAVPAAFCKGVGQNSGAVKIPLRFPREGGGKKIQPCFFPSRD